MPNEFSEISLRVMVANVDEESAAYPYTRIKRKLGAIQDNTWTYPMVPHHQMDIRHRSSNTVEDLQPIKVKGDGNCLYRATSVALFGNDAHWALLRAGGIL